MEQLCKFGDEAAATEPSGVKWKWLFASLCAGLAALLLPMLATAQRIPKKELQFFTQPYTPPATSRLHRKVFLVEINTVVRNAKGAVVTGLKKQDFKVYDKGKQQTITKFVVQRPAPAIVHRQSATKVSVKTPSGIAEATAAKPAPRNIELFFDDRKTPFRYLKYAQSAAEKFVREDLYPGDEVGVFTASRTVTQNFTNNRQKLLKAVAAVHVAKVGTPLATFNTCPVYPMGPYIAYRILDLSDTEALHMYTERPCSVQVNDVQTEAQIILSATENVDLDTLENLAAVAQQMKQMPGSRVVVLIRSGFFTATLKRALDAVAQAALDSEVVIDSLNAQGLVAVEGSRNADKLVTGSRYYRYVAHPAYTRMLDKDRIAEAEDVLSSLAMDTGGIYFHDRNDLANGLAEMAAVPEASYLIGFTPSHLKDNGSYHRLKVKLTTPGSFKIEARPGYFAPPRPSRKKKGKQNKIDPEVLKTNDVGGFPVGVKAQAGRLPSGKTGMLVSLHVDPRDLKFRKHKGRHLDDLSLVVALFTPNGKFVAGERGLVEMALKNNSLEGLIRRGLNASVVLQAPLGHYRLRVVAEDMQSGKLFATTKQASIP